MIIMLLSFIGLILAIFQFPVTLWRNRLDTEVARKKAIITPLKKEIEMRLSGEAAHKALLGVHKQNNISIFYELRPILPMTIQITLMIFTLKWAADSKVIEDTYLFLGYSVLQWPLLSFDIPRLIQIIFVFSLSWIAFKFFFSRTRKDSLFHKPVSILIFCGMLSLLPMYISIVFISSFVFQNIFIKYTSL